MPAPGIAAIARLLVPSRCPLCSVLAARPDPSCSQCLAELSSEPGIGIGVEAVDEARAIGAYEGAIRRLVVAIKFEGRPGLVHLAAELAIERGPRDLWDGCTPLAIPRAPLRSAVRGYDPAGAFAAALGRRLSCPPCDCLVRLPGPRQTGRDREARRIEGPRFAIAAAPPETVLLVDDVTTTGSTLTNAAEVLRRAGTRVVRAQTVAFTPQRRGVSPAQHRALAPGLAGAAARGSAEPASRLRTAGPAGANPERTNRPEE